MKIEYKNQTIELSDVVFDSRKATSSSLFVAVKGTVVDGHNYIDAAIELGATTVVCQQLPSQLKEGVNYIKCEDSSKELSKLAALFYGEPSKKLKLVGVTGTNGKTTTATLLYDLFTKLGYKCGLISTVIYKVAEKELYSSHTTPDSVQINSLMAQMVDAGCQYCFMEVSSHSIVQHRIEGLKFEGAIFSNITHDHLDYHLTFANYIAAKKAFFDSLDKDSFALYNADDKNGAVMVQNCDGRKRSYSLKRASDYKCKIVESLFGGMLLEIDSSQVWVKFIGAFNGYNLLAVYAAAIELGADKESVLTILSTLTSVAGRFDYIISPSGVAAIVDYAHTPDALQNVIDTINEIRTPNQKLITVVGCGGNRDKTKRPIMAKIAVENSDLAILTSDNPRFENPDDILKDMCEGIESGVVKSAMPKHLVITSRKEAIATAAAFAQGVSKERAEKGEVGDIILIAGKGHETYQEVCGVRGHFDDKEEIKQKFGL